MAAGAAMRLTLMRWNRGTASSRKSGCSCEVAHQRSLARAAEARHAVLHVGDEALPGLLAVVADVDAGLDLGGDDRGGGVLDGLLAARRVDRLAAAPPTVQVGQRRGPGQAAGVGGQDPRLAGEHLRSLADPRGCAGATVRSCPTCAPPPLDDVDRLARIAAAGFYDDPVLSWVFRDDARRLDQLDFVMTGLAGDMLPDRWHRAPRRTTSAPPSGATRPSSTVAPPPSGWRTPSRMRRTSRRCPSRPTSSSASASSARLMMANHPHEPHWYLNVVSTIPEHQGRGLGTTVLQPVLERCDADGARAYLESSNPRNLTLYRRNGFVDAGEIPLPDGPSLIKMWRDPR